MYRITCPIATRSLPLLPLLFHLMKQKCSKYKFSTSAQVCNEFHSLQIKNVKKADDTITSGTAVISPRRARIHLPTSRNMSIGERNIVCAKTSHSELTLIPKLPRTRTITLSFSTNFAL